MSLSQPEGMPFSVAVLPIWADIRLVDYFYDWLIFLLVCFAKWIGIQFFSLRWDGLVTADNQVGWVKADTKAIQAIHTTVVTHNPRVSVEHVGLSQWKLIIKSVRKEDAGFYMAQISKSQLFC